MNENTMKCDNCKYGYVTRNATRSKVLRVECTMFKHDVNLIAYKNLRCCQWFEKR